MIGVSGAARLAGIMGWPVKHSRSPRLHGAWLKNYGIDGVYVPLPVAPENLGAALKALPILGFAGVNLTVPHKETALRFMDEITSAARRIGAVNTVTVLPSGKLRGDNTDCFGFIANLETSLPAWRAAVGPAVVLGAGGAARAVIAGLLDQGCPEVRLANRSQARAEAVARDLSGPDFSDKIRLIPWPIEAADLKDASLLVNTTSLGMMGQPSLEVSLQGLPTRAVVTDVVYAPLQTDLLVQAKKRGHQTVDGLGMLLHQGRPAFAAWFGKEPEVTPELRQIVLGEIAAEKQARSEKQA